MEDLKQRFIISAGKTTVVLPDSIFNGGDTLKINAKESITIDYAAIRKEKSDLEVKLRRIKELIPGIKQALEGIIESMKITRTDSKAHKWLLKEIEKWEK